MEIVKMKKINKQVLNKSKKIIRLCENNKIIKKYFDYKMQFIKDSFKINVMALCNDILQNEKLLKKYGRTHTEKDFINYQNYLYQTPKNINEVKGIVLTQLS